MKLMGKKTLVAVVGMILLCVAPLLASYEGLSVSTSYPALNVSDSDMIVFDLKVNNYDMAPGRVDLSVSGLPKGWDYQFVGGGGQVSAVFAAPNNPVDVQLWVIPNDGVKAGSYDFNVTANGKDATYSLPLTVLLGQKLPERLSLTTELKTINGAPDSDFTFQVTLHNNSAAETLINLNATVPDGFKAAFYEQYGSKEMSTVSIAAGATKTMKVTVTPPQGVSEGSYPVTVIAKAATTSAAVPVTLQVKGQPKLALSGENGILSFSAVAGKEKVFTLELKNSGTADAKDVSLTASSPSNWNVTFTPSKLDSVAAGATTKVKMTVNPSSQAITGDYGLTANASTSSSRVSQQFRVTIKTSSLWGLVAILIIAGAVIILLLAVKKFGRR
ncbi:MAG: NEW3 domain-containing protein [Spirochaetia bacterium]|jgi:uncharacterized membrane protein|nr:NEW3 domain-containing protein [Spirochaetia bacterium]